MLIITVPNSITSIGEGAFQNCESLASITIPDGMTSIGKNAFSGCKNLNCITIPNNVTSIGEGAFRDCSSLKSITKAYCSKVFAAIDKYPLIESTKEIEDFFKLVKNAKYFE